MHATPISHGAWGASAPRIVVSIGRTRRANFGRALAVSGIEATLEVLTFPNRPKQVVAFQRELTELVRQLDAARPLLA